MIPQDCALRLQLAAIAGNEPAGSYIEIRPLEPAGRQVFAGVRDLDGAAAAISALRDRHQVYVGAAPRVERRGNGEAIERVWCLWADCDGAEALQQLAAFVPLPSFVIRTGSDEHAHAYWPLRKPVAPEWAKRANRRLALALGADMKATDAVRVLRPACTLNHKHQPPQPVLCTRLELDVFTFERVVGGLPDDHDYAPPPRPAQAPKTASPSSIVDGLARTVRDAQSPIGKQPGNRNSALYWAACRVREHAEFGRLDAAQAARTLRDAARQAGLDEREISGTIGSALGFAA